MIPFCIVIVRIYSCASSPTTLILVLSPVSRGLVFSWYITARPPVAATAQAHCTWFYPGQAAVNAMTSMCRTLAANGEVVSEAVTIAEMMEILMPRLKIQDGS